MCGLAGVISDSIVQLLCVKKMIDTIGYRGPDDKNYVGVSLGSKEIHTYSPFHNVQFQCIAGFTRLSIRDLSEDGKQPMVDDGIILSFVGEIFNAFEMRVELIELGDCFTGKSDTEIILKWYKRFGIDGLINTLNGMYAIVLIDTNINLVYLLRDRFGIKPLYFLKTDGSVIYASEMKSIIASDYYRSSLNENALADHMLYRSPIGVELFTGIDSVSPGELVTYSLTDKRLFRRRWFDYNSYKRLSVSDISYAEAYNLLDERLYQSVGRQLISDVPVGVQLSGGIDSGLIVGVARKYRPIETFSTIIDLEYYSEEAVADLSSYPATALLA